MTSDADRIYWSDRVAEGLAARQAGDYAAWDLGRLALTVATEYGAGDLQKYADEIGIEYNTLRSYRTVVEAFPEFDPRGSNLNLTWTVFKMLASREDRAMWLVRAASKDWTTRELLREIDMADGAKAPPPPPKDRPEKVTAPQTKFRPVEGFQGWLRTQAVNRQWLFDTFERAPDGIESTATEVLEGFSAEYAAQLELWEDFGPRVVRELQARNAQMRGESDPDEDSIEHVRDDDWPPREISA